MSISQLKPLQSLSFKSPWPWLCLTDKLKDIENRSQKWEFSELRIFVHSSLNYDRECVFWVAEKFGNELAVKLMETPIVKGAIVGELTLLHYATESESKWFFGPYGYPIKDGLMYKHSYPMKGRLGLFDVPMEIRQQIKQNEDVKWSI